MKYDKIIKIILLALPILVLVLSVIPGMVTYTQLKDSQDTGFMLIQPLPEGVVASSSQLTIILTIFTLIAGFVYHNSSSLAAIRLYMIFSVTNLFFTAAPLNTDRNLCVMPYAVFSIIICVGFVLSLLVMLKEKRLFDERKGY